MTKSELRIDWCTHEAAKYACEKWHYSGLIPPQKLVHLGVWENGDFRGAVVFGDGANFQAFSAFGISSYEGCELVRVALRKHVTPVSRIIAIAIRFVQIRCPRIRIIVSYADTTQGHHGGIYQAGNWVYTGRSSVSRVYVVNGKEYHQQSLDCQRLRRHPDRCKTTLDWARKYRDKNAKLVKKPGKHRYLMPLDEAMRKQIEPLRRPYPKRVGSADSGTSNSQLERGGANPTPTLSVTREEQ
jgi:hypothetical protein